MSLLNATTKARVKLISSRLIHKTLDLLLVCFALKPCKRCHLLYQVTLGIWLLWLISASVLAARHTYGSATDFAMGSTVTTLFLARILAHAALLLETLLKRQCQQAIRRQQLHICKQLSCSGGSCNRTACSMASQRDIAWLIAAIASALMLNHAIIMWSVLAYTLPWVAVYWCSLLSVFALHLKLITLLAEIMLANAQLVLVNRRLQAWGECNWLTFFGLLDGNACTVLSLLNEDEIQLELRQLKRVYSDIYRLYEQLNDGHGVSFLAITIVSFMDFMCNAYWLFRDLLMHRLDFYAITQNMGVLLNVFLLLTTICWHCQRSYNFSRDIGCLICKLVKPLGNKRYNDLVSEFLLQTLHQRFVITAKDFFSLNLHLLGSMFAAIVTYLVILIQFMFAEKSAKERAEANITITTAIAMTTTTTTAAAALL